MRRVSARNYFLSTAEPHGGTNERPYFLQQYLTAPTRRHRLSYRWTIFFWVIQYSHSRLPMPATRKANSSTTTREYYCLC